MEEKKVFAETYPHIERWLDEQGWIEMGQDEYSSSFVRAIDPGGLVWEGKDTYRTTDAALHDMNKALGKWWEENG
jgi:hypothetical protein